MKYLTKEISIINKGTIKFPILPNGEGWRSTEKEKLSVIESGEGKVLFSKIIEVIHTAKQMICLQSFLIQDIGIIDALVRAVEERKVKVFVLSSAEARLKDTIEEEPDFIKAKYIHLLDTKFKNHFIHRIAENFHAKYILVDPSSNPKGFLCTNNFTENGFLKNPELAVELNNEQSAELFKIFVYHFWEHATDEQTATSEFDKVRPAVKFALPNMRAILLTSPNRDYNTLADSLLESVKTAKQSIFLSTFLLDKNEALLREIQEKAKIGLSITMFCRPIEKQFNEQLKDLLDCGIEIYFHPFMHAKTLLIDSSIGFLFTANLTAKGLNSGLEVGVRLSKEQTDAMSNIHQGWKTNFPYKAVKQVPVQTTNKYFVFKDNRITSKLLIKDSKEKKQKVGTVSDLFGFFNQKYEIHDSNTKSLDIKLIAELNILPEKIIPTGTGNHEILEFEGNNGQKEKWVVVGNGFTQSDLEMLLGYEELKIFYREEGVTSNKAM